MSEAKQFSDGKFYVRNGEQDEWRLLEDMYFCHMDIKYADKDWTEGETVKTFSKEKALANFKEVQQLREKGVLVKNLKLCKVGVVVEQVEQEEESSNE